MVDDFDLIFEFGVGRNFDVQGEDPECLKHYRLQYQNGHVVLVVENSTALADRREPSDFYLSLNFVSQRRGRTGT